MFKKTAQKPGKRILATGLAAAVLLTVFGAWQLAAILAAPPDVPTPPDAAAYTHYTKFDLSAAGGNVARASVTLNTGGSNLVNMQGFNPSAIPNYPNYLTSNSQAGAASSGEKNLWIKDTLPNLTDGNIETYWRAAQLGSATNYGGGLEEETGNAGGNKQPWAIAVFDLKQPTHLDGFKAVLTSTNKKWNGETPSNKDFVNSGNLPKNIRVFGSNDPSMATFGFTQNESLSGVTSADSRVATEEFKSFFRDSAKFTRAYSTLWDPNYQSLFARTGNPTKFMMSPVWPAPRDLVGIVDPLYKDQNNGAWADVFQAYDAKYANGTGAWTEIQNFQQEFNHQYLILAVESLDQWVVMSEFEVYQRNADALPITSGSALDAAKTAAGRAKEVYQVYDVAARAGVSVADLSLELPANADATKAKLALLSGGSLIPVTSSADAEKRLISVTGAAANGHYVLYRDIPAGEVYVNLTQGREVWGKTLTSRELTRPSLVTANSLVDGIYTDAGSWKNDENGKSEDVQAWAIIKLGDSAVKADGFNVVLRTDAGVSRQVQNIQIYGSNYDYLPELSAKYGSKLSLKHDPSKDQEVIDEVNAIYNNGGSVPTGAGVQAALDFLTTNGVQVANGDAVTAKKKRIIQTVRSVYNALADKTGVDPDYFIEGSGEGKLLWRYEQNNGNIMLNNDPFFWADKHVRNIDDIVTLVYETQTDSNIPKVSKSGRPAEYLPIDGPSWPLPAGYAAGDADNWAKFDADYTQTGKALETVYLPDDFDFNYKYAVLRVCFGWEGNSMVLPEFSLFQKMPTRNVEFQDFDGAVLKASHEVMIGGDAVPPANPTREGYTFTGWDTAYTNVQAGTGTLIVKAAYSKNSYKLSVSAGAGGTVTSGVKTNETTPFGTSITVTAAPDGGMLFSGWFAPGGSVPVYTDAAKTFTMPANDLSLEARFVSGSNPMSVTAQAGGTAEIIFGTPSVDPALVPFGTGFTATATPDSGYVFDGWYEGDVLASNDAVFTGTTPARAFHLTARFKLQSYSLVVTSGGNGAVRVATDPEAANLTRVSFGTHVTLTATPAAKYVFDGWYNEANGKVSENAVYVFSMPAENLSLTAKFVKKSAGLTVIAGTNGDASITNGGNGSEPIEADTLVTVLAAPAAGYAFDGWYNEAGVKVSANAEYTFKMPEEATVLTAKFAAKTYSAAVSATTGGLASLDTGGFPADGIPYGTSLTATATVGEGYWFDGWFDGETLVSGELVYTFAMSDGGANLTARFSEKQAAVLVTVSPAEGGTVTIDAGGADVRNIPAGTTVQLRATPAAGQEFAGWFIDGTVLGKDAGYAFVAEKFTYPLEARFQKFGTNDSRENADTGNNLPLAFVLTALSALLAGGVLFLAAKRRRV